MVITKEHISKEMEALDDRQLKEIADFIAFIKFRARYSSLPVVDSQLSSLYAEFADEDQRLSEEGMADYTDMLKKEDSL
jgi:hypothetical protein